MYLKNIADVEWINLAQDVTHWQDFTNMLLKIWIP